MAKKRAKKSGLMDRVFSAAMLGAGGFAGSQLTGLLAKQIGNEQIAPLVTAGLGIGGMIAVPSFSDAFRGMVSNGIAEALETLLSNVTASTAKPTTTTTQGISNTLGFVPTRMPDGAMPTTVDGRPVRY